MALTSTVHTLDVTLSDVDRGVYETLAFRMARHPSETAEYFVARLLAYCLSWEEGIAFSRGGLSDPDEPPLAVRDLTGTLRAWIEIGAPDADRLHKAAKAAPRVAVYTHRDPTAWRRQLAGARIHRGEAIRVHALDRALVAALAERLDRRMALTVSVTDGVLYVDVGGEVLTGGVDTGGVFDPVGD